MVYHIIRTLVGIAVRVRFRLTIKGKENIPEGGVIIAMNHQSYWDSLLVGTSTPRKLHIMAKESLFNNRLLAWTIKEMGAFPINRNKADIKSLKNSLKILNEGKLFSLFIEGTRSMTGEIQEPKKGVGFIVVKSGAPVIPTYIYGTNSKQWFSEAGVIFGKQISFCDETDYEIISTTIANAINELKNKASEQNYKK